MKSRFIAHAYQFCPKCGASNAQPGASPMRCSACHYSVFFGPVAAVGGIIVRGGGEALFVRRARDPGKGKWGLPGGFIDRGESAEQALVREVREETELSVSHCQFLVSFPNRYVYQGFEAPVLDLFYLCRVDDEAKIEIQLSELDQYRWMVPNEELLGSLAFASNRRAIEHWMNTEQQQN